MKEYALYKGDQIIAVGTANQIAEEIGVKPETVYYYKSPSYQRRVSGKNGRVLVDIDEDESED